MATYVPKNITDLEQYVLKQTMSKVQETMTKKFYDIFDKTYQKYADMFYGEFNQVVYPRLCEFKDKVQHEIKPYIQGKSIVCGIDFTTKDLTLDIWRSPNLGNVKRYKSDENREAYEPEEVLEDSLLYGGHGFYEYTDTAPYVETVKELKNNMDLFINELKSELSKNGFIVK